jgi:ParB family chromosome partitioning protein
MAKRQRVDAVGFFDRAGQTKQDILQQKDDLIADLQQQIQHLNQRGIEQESPIEDIIPLRLGNGLSQPRYYFSQESLERLAASIQKHGLAEPLIVRQATDQKLEIVAGERRYRAAQIAGLKTVPYRLKQLSDDAAYELAIIDNLFREDLNSFEQTDSMLNLVALKLDLDREGAISTLWKVKNFEERSGKLSEEDQSRVEIVQSLFEPFGISVRSFVVNRLPILDLPDTLLQAVRDGAIEPTKANFLAKVDDAGEREKLLQSSIAENWSTAQIRTVVKARQNLSNTSPALGQYDETSAILASTSRQLNKIAKKLQKGFEVKNKQNLKRISELSLELRDLMSSL